MKRTFIGAFPPEAKGGGKKGLNQKASPAKKKSKRRKRKGNDDRSDLNLWLSHSQENVNSNQHTIVAEVHRDAEPTSPPSITSPVQSNVTSPHNSTVTLPIHTTTTASTTGTLPPAPSPSHNTLSRTQLASPTHADISVNSRDTSDTIDIALGIAKDASSMKQQLERVEQIIANTRNVNTSEHEALVVLLGSIHDYACRIDAKANNLEDKLSRLSDRVQTQDKKLEGAQKDIEKLFSAVSQLEKRSAPTSSPCTTSEPMEAADDQPDEKHALVFSGMPNSKHDEQDIRALMYVGLCLDANEIDIRRVHRETPRTGGTTGNIVVEVGTVDQKIKVLSRKLQLRHTNEYYNVFIRPLKSRSVMIAERNFNRLLTVLPGNHNMTMSSNGKIVDRQHTRNYHNDVITQAVTHTGEIIKDRINTNQS